MALADRIHAASPRGGPSVHADDVQVHELRHARLDRRRSNSRQDPAVLYILNRSEVNHDERFIFKDMALMENKSG